MGLVVLLYILLASTSPLPRLYMHYPTSTTRCCCHFVPAIVPSVHEISHLGAISTRPPKTNVYDFLHIRYVWFPVSPTYEQTQSTLWKNTQIFNWFPIQSGGALKSPRHFNLKEGMVNGQLDSYSVWGNLYIHVLSIYINYSLIYFIRFLQFFFVLLRFRWTTAALVV